METVELAYDVYTTHDTDHSKCPIILLHGLFWNKFMYRELANDLCKGTKRKVFCLDLRCHDQSPFREECTSELMAEDIKQFIKDKELEKVTMVCHSFSACIAYLILLDQPEVIEKIVMIDHPPFAVFTEAFYQKEVYSQFAAQERFLKTFDPSLSLTDAKKRMLKLCAGASEGQKIFLRKVAYDLIKVNNEFKWKTNHKFLIDKYYEGDLRPKPRGSSDHEILIIRAKDSKRVSDEKFAAVLQYNPNAKLITIPDTTHLLMFEKKQEFIEAVKDFLL